MSLSDISERVRLIIKISLYVFVGYYLIVFLIIPLGGRLINAVIPDRDPPNTEYGLLPPLHFKNVAITGTPSYELNTKTGGLPSGIPSKMIVYKFKTQPFSYQAGKNAEADAAVLGFQPNDLITDLKGDTYRWRNIGSGGILEIKVNTKELTLSTNIANRPQFYTASGISEDGAVATAKALFSKLNRFNDGLYSSGTWTVKFGKFAADKLIETSSPSEAQVAIVNLFRSINEYPIVTQDFTKGQLSTWMRAPNRETSVYNFPNLRAYYWEIDSLSTGTYPIISVKEAWDQVKSGNGIVSSAMPKGANPFESVNPPQVNEILINSVYLAYYETPDSQEYLQPIYVFEGNYKTQGTSGGDIVIYFPAISKEQIQIQE